MLAPNLWEGWIKVDRTWYGDHFCALEHPWQGIVTGEFLAVPGHGQRIDFRMQHVCKFTDGKISRENVWLDAGAILAQLTRAV